ncbi:MAG: bifunctional aspartate kinase/homoserine dehydrogenase I [Prolixibacteraceae bacterium]|jgi:bifunctional aspartokinase / homoserine dehydrogenase 1|nr:bifunctional aspartate kinase/homoserine dehydrogenase I [Prolixibacteraceae bacterium]MBT6999961.1 bifunctional aspartate kinase/homoserine dehydrogenase I [Prolixibacteraceae bacterium]MBT7396281.1 bifunctional aspartate kinase/homoserine dehydrogenase I [Prolixibacteraceae bacterium]
MKVLKFGGTSVGSAENIKRISEIVKNQNDDVIVVVSALGGITDKILNAAQLASTGAGDFHSGLKEIKEIHSVVLQSLFNGSGSIEYIVDELLNELEQILTGITLVGELTVKTLDRIAGIGERISSHILAQYIPHATRKDAADFIQTDSNFGKAGVDFEVTNSEIKRAFLNFKGIAVVPGFISKNEKGEFTTLGRGGSDYTAAIISAALEVDALEIWTDVNGFMTADPRIISKAYTIPELTYSEAMELSHFGAKVIYPPTILPVYKMGIPIQIKNTFNPENAGTRISRGTENGKERPIKGISSISGITLLTLQGIGMVGVTGISMRLFSALASVNVNVILISQASSENSISVAIEEHALDLAENAIKIEFEKEIVGGQINKIEIEGSLSIVAIVGENMKHTTGIAGKLFSTIGKNGVNIIAIAQGASELNISWVVKNEELRKTLNVVHESFFLSENAEMNVFLMGIGTVGGNLLQQLLKQQEKLLKEKHLNIKLTGLANSKRMLFDREGIEIASFKEDLDISEKESSLNGFVREMKKMNIYNSVFVDCTASDDVALFYKEILSSNISIVTANKVAASSTFENYSELKKIAKRKGVKFLFETNVGAGLPIINTLNDLVNSGDKILKIEAVLSGTLNYIFNTISEEIPLSQTIKMAKEEGYSEPDPRVDLSGIDVARKILILARESGYPVEMSDIKINKFVPDTFFTGSLENFWDKISELDKDFEQNRKQLEMENKKWRFVARFENGSAEAGLQIVDSRHPFYDLEGSNNLVMYTTERYQEFPMLIKGYGAGASVTAAGVFADIIKVSNI